MGEYCHVYTEVFLFVVKWLNYYLENYRLNWDKHFIKGCINFIKLLKKNEKLPAIFIQTKIYAWKLRKG